MYVLTYKTSFHDFTLSYSICNQSTQSIRNKTRAVKRERDYVARCAAIIMRRQVDFS